MKSNICLCSSGKSADSCCLAIIAGSQQAQTPEQLMRSRYVAYALGGHGAYLLQTWFPATAQGLTIDELSSKTHQWLRLEIISRSQGGEDSDSGEVEFKAWYQEGGEQQCLHEKSVFTRIAGRWYYVGGNIS